MRRKRKRKIRRFRNRFGIWNRVFATVYGVAFGRALFGGNVQNAFARDPTL